MLQHFAEITLLVVTTFTKQIITSTAMKCREAYYYQRILTTKNNIDNHELLMYVLLILCFTLFPTLPSLPQGPPLPLWSLVAQWINKTPPVRHTHHQSSYRLHPTSWTHTHSRYGVGQTILCVWGHSGTRLSLFENSKLGSLLRFEIRPS